MVTANAAINSPSYKIDSCLIVRSAIFGVTFENASGTLFSAAPSLFAKQAGHVMGRLSVRSVPFILINLCHRITNVLSIARKFEFSFNGVSQVRNRL